MTFSNTGDGGVRVEYQTQLIFYEVNAIAGFENNTHFAKKK